MLEIKRTIGVLFAVLLLLSVTATAVSAQTDDPCPWWDTVPHISLPDLPVYSWDIPFSCSAGSFLFRAQLR